MSADSGSLQVVGSYSSSLEAHIARGRLEGAGIEAFVFNDVPGPRLADVVVCVRATDSAEARQLLSELSIRTVSGGKDGAVRTGLVTGGLAGGLLGVITGWPATGAAAGAAIGIAVAVWQWNSSHGSESSRH